jgi:hypothetical protein
MRLAKALRHVLISAAIGFGMASPVSAQMHCDPADARGIQNCKAGLPEHVTQRIGVSQQRSQWCWAAAIQMVFASAGLTVSQAEIAEKYLGRDEDLPIVTKDFAALIDGQWRSRDGRLMTVQARHNGIRGRTPASVMLLVDSLSRSRPLLLAAEGHAVVVVEVRFQRHEKTGMLRLTGGTVLDPLPDRGLRPLEGAELAPEFLGTIEVAATPRRGETRVAGASAPRPL